MAVIEDESHSLPVHVAACSERYKTLFKSVGRIEKILICAAATLILNLIAMVGGLLVVLWKMHAAGAAAAVGI